MRLRDRVHLYLSLFPLPLLYTTMSLSSSSTMIGPVIIFDQSEGTQVPVVPNVKEPFVLSTLTSGVLKIVEFSMGP